MNPAEPITDQPAHVLTFVLCSRNDKYMGNPVGRLELAINYLAENVRALGREKYVEVIVTDWGSDKPLREVLNLTPTAAKITHFLEVPTSVVKEVQKDTPFAEVIALNAAVRHARGSYIGRIDQDTLTGKRFLETFFEWAEKRRKSSFDPEKSFLFCERRQIPFYFAVKDPSLGQVSTFLNTCGRFLTVERGISFFRSPVGVMLIHKSLWDECGGYDERLIYWGWMEVDLAYRLAAKYQIVDIGTAVGYDFYHLEHYDPRTPRKTPRKTNPEKSEGLDFHPNSDEWGLVNYPLHLQEYGVVNGLRTVPVSAFKSWHLPLFTARFLISYCFAQTIRGIQALGRPKRYLVYLERIRNKTKKLS